MEHEMRIYECDRCGAYVKADYKALLGRPYRGIWRMGRRMHLCEECKKDFDSWLYDGKRCGRMHKMVGRGAEVVDEAGD